MKNQTMSLISASSPKSPCGGFRGRKGLFLVFCILGITAHIYGQTDSTGSSVSSVVSVKALPTIPSDSIKAQGRPDSLPVASIALDTAHKTDTMGQAQYQATLPVMRRDVSQGISGQTASPVQQREKFVAPKDTVKPRAKVDKIFIVPVNKSAGNSSGKSQINKRNVFIALGVCAVLGAGIAVYALKSAPGSGSAASNTGIPAPPAAPSNFAPSP